MARRKVRRRVVVSAVFLVLLAVIGVNAIAFMQAWAMTHFVTVGDRTQAPEQLSLPQKVWVLLTGVRVPRPTNHQTPADYNLAFETRHVSSDQQTLETWKIPSASHPKGLVLMYHAYVASKESLLPAAEVFHELGYTTELVDFRGSGGSMGNATTIGYREADDVAATVFDARKNLTLSDEPIILFGQSMGAAAILRAVGELKIPAAPIAAIIIESPYDRLLSTANNRFHSMHLPGFPLAQLLIFWGGAQQGYWGFGMNPSDFARQVHCPVLMFHGNLDARVTTTQANDLFNNLNGPKQLEIFPAGHTAFLSSDASRWRKSVTQFLSRFTASKSE